MPIRIALGQFDRLTDEILRFAAQLGLASIQLHTPRLPGDERWEEEELVALVRRAAEFGLTLEAIENLPLPFCDDILRGGPRRDRQLANYCATLRALGRAGIPILGYHFMPNSVWRTALRAPGRGGAGCMAFDLALVEAATTAEELRRFVPAAADARQAMPIAPAGTEILSEQALWDNYARFMDAVLPVAEEAGVRLALHQDDPPLPHLGGVARLFWRPEGLYRAFETFGSSPAWALDLCLGTCSEMSGGARTVRELIGFFGPRGKIAYIHFRDVQGTVPRFQECFLGEGNCDPGEVMLQLVDVGFDGFIIDDHVPVMDGDERWQPRAHAHAVGYLQGLLRAAEAARRKGPAAAAQKPRPAT